MSAYYACAYEDRIELLTDGAIYTDDGTLIDTRCKALLCASPAMAITGQSNSFEAFEHLACVMLAVSADRTFDEAIGAIADALRRREGGEVTAHMNMLIAGISETGGPRLLLFTTFAHDGYEALRLYDVGGDIAAGSETSLEELTAAGVTARRVEAGLAECGADLFEVMRAKMMINPTIPDAKPLHGIGGHVDLTIVRADSVETARLRTWPDVVGEKINPSRRAVEIEPMALEIG